MMHIALAHFIFIKPVKLLLLGQRSQRTYITDLGLSTGKHGGSMYSGNDINLRCQGTDLGNLTPVRTLMVFQDHLADRLFLILVNCLS